MTECVCLWPSECWEINMLIYLHLSKSSLRESKHLWNERLALGRGWFWVRDIAPSTCILTLPLFVNELYSKVYYPIDCSELWILCFPDENLFMIISILSQPLKPHGLQCIESILQTVHWGCSSTSVSPVPLYLTGMIFPLVQPMVAFLFIIQVILLTHS